MKPFSYKLETPSDGLPRLEERGVEQHVTLWHRNLRSRVIAIALLRRQEIKNNEKCHNSCEGRREVNDSLGGRG
jgi:hypothetical protein